MKRRIIDDDGGSGNPAASIPPAEVSAPAVLPGIEKLELPSGVYLYRYHLGSFPPNVLEHDKLNRVLGSLISKLMVSTSGRMEPFVCLDGRHLNDDFFARLRQSGATWRALLGFPMIPGFQPFRYLPIAYHIHNRDAWNEVAEEFLGTGGVGIYLTSLKADDFLSRLIQLVFTRNSQGATDLFKVYLPEVVLSHFEKAVGPSLKPVLETFQFYIGERASQTSVDIISSHDIDHLLKTILEK